MGTAADWASVAVTVLLGVVGLVVARNIRRDVQLRVTERRLIAYERLWALMRVVSPYNPPPDSVTRSKLHEAFTDWYYAHGDGMLLEQGSRSVYLAAKDNLVRPLSALTPTISRHRLEALDEEDLDRQRGLLSRRQISLLRTQLKSDLAIYGRPYGPPLDEEDLAFLSQCNVDTRRRPWRKGP